MYCRKSLAFLRHNSKITFICSNLRGRNERGTQTSKPTNSKYMLCAVRTRLKRECCSAQQLICNPQNGHMHALELTLQRQDLTQIQPVCISCFWFSAFLIGFPSLFLDFPFLFLLEKIQASIPEVF